MWLELWNFKLSYFILSIINHFKPFQGSKAANPFLSPSKLSLLQTFGNFQQQQQLLQQAVSSAASIAPNYQNQQQSLLNLSETEAKFREFAFKTMQELLNIYGLSISPNDIVDALKQQHLGERFRHYFH